MLIERRAARALLIAGRSVLLIRGHDPARSDAGAWWLTPGGGIEHGESVEAALTREVFEETGLALTPDLLGPVVATRVAEFEFANRQYRQAESFFAIEVAAFTPTTAGWDRFEQNALLHHRWWDIQELATTNETVYPRELAQLVQAVLDRTVGEPVRLGTP